jgi:hypothetical protein
LRAVPSDRRYRHKLIEALFQQPKTSIYLVSLRTLYLLPAVVFIRQPPLRCSLNLQRVGLRAMRGGNVDEEAAARDRPSFLPEATCNGNDEEIGAHQNPEGVIADERDFGEDANDRNNKQHERCGKSPVAFRFGPLVVNTDPHNVRAHQNPKGIIADYWDCDKDS